MISYIAKEDAKSGKEVACGSKVGMWGIGKKKLQFRTKSCNKKSAIYGKTLTWKCIMPTSEGNEKDETFRFTNEA